MSDTIKYSRSANTKTNDFYHEIATNCKKNLQFINNRLPLAKIYLILTLIQFVVVDSIVCLMAFTNSCQKCMFTFCKVESNNLYYTNTTRINVIEFPLFSIFVANMPGERTLRTGILWLLQCRIIKNVIWFVD